MSTTKYHYTSPVKRICVFEHSVMTNFNCACPAIQRGQRSGFLSEGSSWLTACMSEQQRFWRDCADAQARLNFCCSHRRYYQIRLTRSIQCHYSHTPNQHSHCSFIMNKSTKLIISVARAMWLPTLYPASSLSDDSDRLDKQKNW